MQKTNINGIRSIALYMALSLVMLQQIYAQTLPSVKSIEDYWPKNEIREFVFVINDSIPLGTLKAQLDRMKMKRGVVTEFRFSENLDLAFTKGNAGADLSIVGSVSLVGFGALRGVDYTVESGGRKLKLKARYDEANGVIKARWTGDAEQTLDRQTDSMAFAAEDYMLHHLELMLAGYELTPGEQISIPVFSPSKMYSTTYEFLVAGKTAVRYGPFADSVWQVNMITPFNYRIFIDQKHQLVKLTDVNRKITAERKRDIFAGRRQQQEKATTTIDDYIARIPFYGLLLFISAMIIIVYGLKNLGQPRTYWLFGLGAVAYQLVFITQVPMQQAYVQSTILPAIQAGKSIYGLSVVPALLGGFIQQTLKLLPIAFAAWFLRDKKILFIGLGAIVGVGFGFAEAAYVAGPLFQAKMLTNAIFFERLTTLMFQTALGAVIGYGFDRGRWWIFWLLAVVMQTVSMYLIVFVQSKAMTVDAFRTLLIMSFLVIFAAGVALRYKDKLPFGRKK